MTRAGSTSPRLGMKRASEQTLSPSKRKTLDAEREMTKLAGEKTELKERIEGKITRIDKNVERALLSVMDMFKEARKVNDEKMEKLNGRVETELSKAKSDVDNELTAAKDKINVLKQHVENFIRVAEENVQDAFQQHERETVRKLETTLRHKLANTDVVVAALHDKNMLTINEAMNIDEAKAIIEDALKKADAVGREAGKKEGQDEAGSGGKANAELQKVVAEQNDQITSYRDDIKRLEAELITQQNKFINDAKVAEQKSAAELETIKKAEAEAMEQQKKAAARAQRKAVDAANANAKRKSDSLANELELKKKELEEAYEAIEKLEAEKRAREEDDGDAETADENSGSSEEEGQEEENLPFVEVEGENM